MQALSTLLSLLLHKLIAGMVTLMMRAALGVNKSSRIYIKSKKNIHNSPIT
jgi:hypothetical protein